MAAEGVIGFRGRFSTSVAGSLTEAEMKVIVESSGGHANMTLDELSDIQKRLNAIGWYSARTITPKAEELVKEHIARMTRVFDHLLRVEKKSPLVAYSDAQSAGYSAEMHDEFFDAVHDGVDLGQVPSKMPIVLSLVAHYFWKDDPDLGHLDDPWEPVVELFELGYTATFDQDDHTETLDFVLEYPGHRKHYPLVGSGVPEAARS